MAKKVDGIVFPLVLVVSLVLLVLAVILLVRI